MYGWAGNILRIDLSEHKATVEPVDPYVDKFIGGRGISVKVLFDEVGPQVKPYDPENRLVFGPGVLGGTPAPTAQRTQVTTIGPSGAIVSSGIGGSISPEIKFAGYDSIIVQGKSERPVYVLIRDGQVEFRDAGHLWGKNPLEVQRVIREENADPDIQIMCIGPAGEKLVSCACILTGMYSAAGHGGYGAVMGSKNLKAIAVRGRRGVKIARMDEFLAACYEMQKFCTQSRVWQRVTVSRGMNILAEGVRAGLAVWGNMEEGPSDEATAQKYEQRCKEFVEQYRVGRVGCAGCPMHHYNVFDVPGTGAAAPKCAAWAAFGWPLWGDDHESMFRIGTLCNEYGLNFASAAGFISFLTELHTRGIITEKDTDGIAMKRGDYEAAIAMLHKIGSQEGFGTVFRDGVLQAARTIGRGAEEYALHVKGVEIVQGEFRPFKTMALGYAAMQICADVIGVEEVGLSGPKEQAEERAERLCGAREAGDLSSYAKKGLLLANMEERVGVVEMLGVCKYYMIYVTPVMELPAKLFSLATGVEATEADLMRAASRMRTLTKAINLTRGIKRKDDTLPGRTFGTAVTSGPFKGAVLDRQKFEEMLDEYYEMCGWDAQGIPTEQTFTELGLATECKAFRDRMRDRQSG